LKHGYSAWAHGRSRSIRFRLTTLFLVIFGTTLIVLSTIGYRFFSHTQQRDFDAALFNHVVDVGSTVDINFFGEVSIPQSSEAFEENKIFPFSLRRSYMQLLDIQGHVIAKSGNLQGEQLPLSPQDYEDAVRRGISLRTISEPLPESLVPKKERQSYRLLSYRLNKPSLPPMILQLAAPMTFLNRVQEDIRSFLYIAIPHILGFASIGGFLLSRRALRPVHLMTRKAASIQVGNLSERVPVPPSFDEISELAVTFNRLLDRIETTVSTNQRFVADASHQLKTPLSILRGELDLMLSKERSPAEIRAFLTSASQEIDSLTQLAESLLILARVEAGSACIAHTEVRLDEIALEAVSHLDPIAKQKQIRIKPNLRAPLRAESSFEFRGDVELLRIMIVNLVENAIKYSPPESMVGIDLDDQGDFLTLSIADQGPGIPPEKVSKIFERFYRDPSTQSSARGFGLGLPIAQTIARAHGAEILVTAAPGGGSVFSVRMKK